MHKIPLDFEWDIKIPTFLVGHDRCLRLSSQLSIQQEIGEIQFEKGGLGCEQLVKLGWSFVITRLSSRIYRAPIFNERVKVVTWFRNTVGAQFFRCYQFLDSDRRPLIDSVSAFALIDFNTHKILRPSLFDDYNVSNQPERHNGCPDPKRIKIPESVRLSDHIRVGYTDIDYIGHLNNAVYADIICNAMPGGMEGKRITDFSISYLKEATEGEHIDIYTALSGGQSAKGQAWFEGKHERGRCFEAYVGFEKTD